jgi:hypothetical protein
MQKEPWRPGCYAVPTARAFATRGRNPVLAPDLGARRPPAGRVRRRRRPPDGGLRVPAAGTRGPVPTRSDRAVSSRGARGRTRSTSSRLRPCSGFPRGRGRMLRRSIPGWRAGKVLGVGPPVEAGEVRVAAHEVRPRRRPPGRRGGRSRDDGRDVRGPRAPDPARRPGRAAPRRGGVGTSPRDRRRPRSGRHRARPDVGPGGSSSRRARHDARDGRPPRSESTGPGPTSGRAATRRGA